MKICIIGGAGYVGSALVPHLIHRGHKVTVLDTFWYGDYLKRDTHLTKIVGDMRSKADLRKSIKGQDAVIHLACVSNDPSFDMNPKLGKSVNYDSFKGVLDVLQQENISRFIYASSSSVYGVSKAHDVVEATRKKPLTDYSKYKLACETMLKTYGSGGIWTILRPATVCGYSPRMRLDLVVNILTIHALKRKKITIFGTKNIRPNINIQDMVRAYEFILEKPYKQVDQQIYNVGFENLNLLQIANLVKRTIGDPDIQIEEELTIDKRSYHINSDKILELGFKPRNSVKEAIRSIKENIIELISPLDNPAYYNINKMKEIGLT